MDGQTLREDVEADQQTPLSRLGSDKALLALTDATLESARVLSVVAGTERALAETFAEWAGVSDHERAAEAFEAVATEAKTHADSLADGLDEDAMADVDVALTQVNPESDPARVAAGLVGQSLVLDQSLLQAVSFFVNEADSASADRMREVRSDVQTRAETGADVLETVCTSEEEWAQAEEAAAAVIDAAYQSYVEALEEMGLDPKPVC